MSEIGVIGQMYEDRRTKKRGKLVERDDKYKTLLMESEDGKSFNVSFGGFKSNWRSCEVAEPTVEEAMQEVELTEVEVKEEKPKKEKKKYKERQVSIKFEDTVLEAMDYAKSFNNDKVTVKVIPKKRNVVLKVGTRRICIITTMTSKDIYLVCVSDNLYPKIHKKKYIENAKYNENWACLRYSFNMSTDNLAKFFEDIRQYVIDFLCGEE